MEIVIHIKKPYINEKVMTKRNGNILEVTNSYKAYKYFIISSIIIILVCSFFYAVFFFFNTAAACGSDLNSCITDCPD